MNKINKSTGLKFLIFLIFAILLAFQFRFSQRNWDDKSSFPNLYFREDLGKYLEFSGAKVGCEVGVQLGYFSESILSRWPSCTKYILVDLWAHQEKNYIDGANVDNREQQNRYQATIDRTIQWKDKLQIYRMLSIEAASKIPDYSLDFVYLDARHDYCGVTEDLNAYFSKVKVGGIIAGHDYKTQWDKEGEGPNEDWGVCQNGTRNNGAVKGAVDEFMNRKNLKIHLTSFFGTKTWMVRVK